MARGGPLGGREAREARGPGLLYYKAGPEENVLGATDPHAVGGGRATWVGLCHRNQRA